VLRVVYSNRPGKLAEAFGRYLADTVGLPPRDPFRPVELLVASRPLQTWLVHQLAPVAGVVGNLDIRLLRRFTGQLVAQAFPGRQVLDGDAIRDLLLTQFLDGAIGDAALGPVRSYLGGAGGAADQLRAVQLATQLGHVFEEYVFARRTMLADWAADRPSALDGGGELARWQRRLWQQVLEQAGDERVLPTALLDVAPERLVTPGEPLLVYGLSFIGASYYELLVHLAQATEVALFAVNPCREFWEDVEPARRRRPRRHRGTHRAVAVDATANPGSEDCRLLTLWGGPGREAIRLLTEATDGDADEAFDETPDPDADEPTLLRQLRADVLRRTPSRRPAHVAARSADVEFAPCPSVRRECEFVAGRIWALLAQPHEPPLRLDEIAVLVAPSDPETYVAPLLSAFHDHHQLPWQLVGIPHVLSSPMVEASLLLLGLPRSRFTRADVLRVLTHPVVAARYPEADVDAWVRWVDSAGIVLGADRADHAGTYVDRDLLSWDQGLRRIGLGAFLTTVEEHDGRQLPVDKDAYLPDAGGRHLDDGAGSLLLLARSLLADCNRLRDAALTVAEWATTLATLLQTYLVPRDDGERRALDACLRVVRGLATRPLGDRRLATRTALELVEAELAEAGSRTGGAVNGGVRISTLAASRGIPARVTFVVGLTEGAFPAGDRSAALDLRHERPQPGDVSGRERDQYLFLEALLATDDRLVLSYVARDERTGDTREPSPVVAELRRLLDDLYLPERAEGAPHPLHRAVPLWRADAPGDDDDVMLPTEAGLAERRLRRLAAPLAVVGGPYLPGTLIRQVTGELSPEVRASLEAELGLMAAPAPAPAPTPTPSGTVRRVTATQLRAFLQCPLQGSTAVRLGIGSEEDADDDTLERTGEILTSAGRQATLLLRRVYERAWRAHGGGEPPDDDALDAAWQAITAPLVAQARLPQGVFLASEKLYAATVMKRWSELLREQRLSAGTRMRVLRLGGGDDSDEAEELRDAFTFQLGDEPGADAGALTVRLVGRSLPLVALDSDDGITRSCSVLLQRTGGVPQRADGVNLDARIWCQGWVDYLLLAASGLVGTVPHRFLSLTPKEAVAYEFAPKTPEAARDELRTLLHDLLLGDCELRAPVEAMLRFAASGDAPGAPTTRRFEFALHCAHDATFSPSVGAVRWISAYRVPDDAEATALLQRRYAELKPPLEAPRRSKTPKRPKQPASPAVNPGQDPPKPASRPARGRRPRTDNPGDGVAESSRANATSSPGSDGPKPRRSRKERP
jgi:exodeoxyribonuclease V gamma subunit